MVTNNPLCPYCNNLAELVNGEIVYPHRKDLYEKLFYICKPCDAYVGVHVNTTNPLGRLANAKLRHYKKKAHEAFDPLWKNSYMSRKEAYKWLAKKLNIPAKDCHIGMFNIAQCKRVIYFSKHKHTALLYSSKVKP